MPNFGALSCLVYGEPSNNTSAVDVERGKHVSALKKLKGWNEAHA